jgi:hypothetical protein
MSEDTGTLLARLNSESDKTIMYFNALNDNQSLKIIYSGTAAWTPRNILAHIVSAESEFLRLFQNVQTGGAGAPLGFFADEFNAAEQERLRGYSMQELMDEFLRLRKNMIDWVANLPSEDLLKTGRHPVLGEIPLWEMIKALTLHAHLHTRDIRRFFEEG